MPPFEPVVDPSLQYLETLTLRGHTPVDVCLRKINRDLCQMDVYLSDDSIEVFYIKFSKSIMSHFREAVEYSGFGPIGLGNLIHADVIEKTHQTGLPQDQFTVFLSLGIIKKLGPLVERWTNYNYKIEIDPSLKGFSYTVVHKGRKTNAG